MKDELNILLHATLDTETTVKNINSKIKEIQKGLKGLNISLDIGDLKEQFKKVFGEMSDIAQKESEKASKEIEKMTHKFTDYGSIFKDGFNTEQFKKDLSELRQEIKSIENIKINYGKDEDGNGLGKLDSVLVTYKDHMGQLVHETMAWAEVTNEEAKEVEHRWQTISVTVEENRRKVSDYANTLIGFKEKMNFKLDVLGDTKDIDPKVIENFRERLNGIGGDIDTAKEEMKSFVLEVQKLGNSGTSLKQLDNLANSLSLFKDRANFKLDMLESTKDIDPSKMKELREAVNGLDVNSENVRQSMKEVNLQIQQTSQTSEKYVDKQKKLSELESKRIVLNRELADLMRDSGVADSKKTDFSKQYSDISKELTTMAKSSKDYTQSEINGLNERLKKLKELISMEVRYQDQLDDRDRTSRRKNNMLDTVSGLQSEGIIDSSVLDELAKKIKAVKDNSTDAKDELDGIDDVLKKMVKNSTEELNKLEKAKKDAFDLNEFKKMQGNKLNLLGDLDTPKQQIEALRQRLNALSADSPELRQEMKSLANDIQLLGSHAQSTGNVMSFLAKYFGFQEVIQLSKRAVSSMVGAVKELDTELMELRKVTSFSSKELENFTETAFGVANQIGHTGSALVSASAEWARAGFDEGELLRLAETSLIMTNIGDGIGDVTEASSYLISALKAYGLEANNAIDVTSALNEVSNNNAIGFQKLAEGLSRTASVYSQAGTDMAELLGLLTGAFEINRNIEKTSSGLITISTRLRSIQLEGEEAVVPIVKLQETFKKVANVDIMDSNTGQLRDTFDILKDLSKVWGNLDTNMRESIAFASAGTRQKSVFLDLMSNFEAVEKAVENARNSQGSALKENAVYMDSIEGKLNALSSAWIEFSNNTLSSDFLKGLIEISTQFVKLIDEGNALIPVLAGVATTITLVSLAGKAGGLFTLIENIKAVGIASVASGVAVSALQVALMGLAGLAVAGGLMAIAGIIDSMIVTVKEQEKVVNDLTEKCDELIAKKEELNGIEHRTEGEEAELRLVEKQIEAQQRLLAIEQERLALKRYDGKGVWGDGEWGDFENKQYDINSSLNALSANRQELDNMLSNWDDSFKYAYEGTVGTIADIEEYLITEYGTLTDKLTQAKADLPYFTDPVKIEEQNTYIEQLQKMIDLIGVATGLQIPYETEIIEAVNAGIKDTATVTREEVDAIAQSLMAKNDNVQSSSQATEAEKKWRDSIIRLFPELGKLYGIVQEGTEDILTQAQAYDEYIKAFDDVSDEIEFLSKALKELNDGHTLSASTLSKIATEYPDLLQHMGEEKDLNQAIQEAISERERRQIEAFENMALQAFLNSEYMQNLDVETHNILLDLMNQYHTQKSEGYEGDLRAYAEMEGAKAKVSENLINGLKEAWAEYFGIVSNSLDRNIQSWADMSSMDWNNLTEAEKNKARALEADQKKLKQQADAIVEEMLKSVNIEIGEAGGITKPETSTKKKDKKDKTSKELDELIKKVQQKRNALDREIDLIQEKLSFAELQGDVENMDKYSKKLAELFGERKVLTEEENNVYRQLKNRFKDSESQLKLEQLMAENSKTWWTDRKSQYEEELSFLERIHGYKMETYDLREKEIELQKLAYDENKPENRDPLLELDLQRYNLILERKEETKQFLQGLYDLGLDLENTQVKEAKESYHELELQRLEWIKERAEAEQKYQQETAKKQLDELTKQKNAIDELTKLVMDMLKKEANMRKDTLKEELKGYKKIIDAKKSALDKEKDEKDYQKGLEERQKEISKIEEKIVELSKDSSAKAQAERLKLEEELQKKREELEEYQYDESINNQKEALDEEYSNFESQINDQLDAIDDYLSKEGALKEQALKLIEGKNKSLFDKLMKWGKEYSSLTEAEIKNIWEKGQEALSNYEGSQRGALETLNEIIVSMQKLNAEIERLDNSSYSDFIGQVTPPTSSGSGGSSSSDSSSSNKKTVAEAKAELQEQQRAYLHNEMIKAKSEGNKGLEKWVKEERKKWGIDPLSGAISQTGVVPADIWEEKKKKYGFRQGGETQSTGLHWLDGEKGKPERVLSAKQTQAFNTLVELAPKLNDSIERMIGFSDGGERFVKSIPAITSSVEKALQQVNTKDSALGTTVDIHFDNMVNIEGNVDKTMDIEEIIKRASRQAIKDLQNTFSNIGITRQVSFK